MTQKIFKVFTVCILICAITFVSNAADLNELQEQKTNIQTQINETTQELTEVT